MAFNGSIKEKFIMISLGSRTVATACSSELSTTISDELEIPKDVLVHKDGLRKALAMEMDSDCAEATEPSSPIA